MHAPTSFNRDIKGLFYKYASDMQGVPLSTPDGDVRRLILNDYLSVKDFHAMIQVALHGYDYDGRSGRWLVPEPQRLPKAGGAGDDRWVRFAQHPMPPDGRMPQQGIDLFDQWVRDGMLP